MQIRMLAFALLAGFSLAHAAPPKSKEPKQDPASAGQSADAIDVDAIARAKDAGGQTEDAPPSQSSETLTPAETPAAIPPADATPPEVAPSEVPPSVGAEAAPPADANVAAEPATNTLPAAAGSPAADATATEAAPDSNVKSASSAEDAEKIRIAASCRARATSLLDEAQKGDFAGATRDFDAKMRTALPAPKLKEAWASLAQFGTLNARGQSHLSSAEGYTVVMIPLIFDKANLVAQVSCGTDGRVAGFYIKPIEKPAP